MEKKLSVLPTQSLIYFLICGAGILVFVLLIIIPAQKTAAELDRNIETLTDRIEEQRILKPVFESLLIRVKKKNPISLPVTKKAKLALGNITTISRVLQDNARLHELELLDIQTDVNALADKAGYLLMRISVTGDFKKFRNFLVDLGKIPSLEQVEEIQIRAIENAREFKLKIWLALS
jgi:hypothetical protein